MKHVLLTWSDRGVSTPPPAHHGRRSIGDIGPVLRLLQQAEYDQRYQAAWIFTTNAGDVPARQLAQAAEAHIRGDVTVVPLAISDPSDHGQLFRAMAGIVADLAQRGQREDWHFDVILSAGTPQVQTLWVILIQAGLLPGRMLQVIPAAFVPNPHPHPVKEVTFEIEGFPEIRALRDEVRRLRAEVRGKGPRLLGESAAMSRIRHCLPQIAAADLPVLLLGETGSGKEVIARAIHEASPRANGPFIAENCGAFAEGLLASELFGHEAGAFSGASGRRRGVFEQAHGGTLFLDEIGEMDGRVQTYLLRVLQEGTFRRVGGEAPIRVNVRIIVATHRDIKAMVASGQFRQDLYYRLRGITLELPSLRQRRVDIPLFTALFLKEFGAAGRLTLSSRVIQALDSYAWPGNIRELRAEVARWTIFCQDRVDWDDLSPEIRQQFPIASSNPSFLPVVSPQSSPPPTLAEVVQAVERQTIQAALLAEGHNLCRTARRLRIDRTTLKRKMRQLELGRD